MLAQKIIFNYFSQMFIQFIQIVCGIVVARIAGPTILGALAFGLSYASMFRFIADLGIGTAHIKLVSEGNDLGKCIKTFSVLKVFCTILFFLAAAGTFLSQKYIFHIKFENITYQYVIIIYIIIAVIEELLFMIPKTTFLAKSEQFKGQIADILKVGLYQIFRVSFVLLGFGALAIALGNLLATCLAVPVIFYLFKNYPVSFFDKELAKKYIKLSAPVIVVLIAQTVVYWSDKVILGYFTNLKEVGYYAATGGVVSFIVLIGSSLGLVFFPEFSKAISEKRYSQINSIIYKFEKFYFIFVLPAAFFVTIFSGRIMKFFFGGAYASSTPILALVSISVFIVVLSQPYINIISGMGLFALSAILYVAQMCFFIVLAIFFVSPSFLNLKGTGMALAICLSNIVLYLLFIAASRIKMPELKYLLNIKLFVFGLVYALVMYSFYNMAKGTGPVFVYLFPVLYFLGFFGLLLLFRLICIEDFKALHQMLKIEKMAKCISSEF